jgi:hypothetical protein
MRAVLPASMNSREAIMFKNLALADIVTKTMYVALAIAAFVFVSMLLLTGLH